MKSADDLLSKVNSRAALSRAIHAFQDLRRVTSATLCPQHPLSADIGLTDVVGPNNDNVGLGTHRLHGERHRAGD